MDSTDFQCVKTPCTKRLLKGSNYMSENIPVETGWRTLSDGRVSRFYGRFGLSVRHDISGYRFDITGVNRLGTDRTVESFETYPDEQSARHAAEQEAGDIEYGIRYREPWAYDWIDFYDGNEPLQTPYKHTTSNDWRGCLIIIGIIAGFALLFSLGPIVELAFDKINRLSAQYEVSQCMAEDFQNRYKRVSGRSETREQPDVSAHLFSLVGLNRSDFRYLYGYSDSKWGKLGTETIVSYEESIWCFASTYTTIDAAIERFEREMDSHGKPSRGIADRLSFYKSSKVFIPELGPGVLTSTEAMLWDAGSPYVIGDASTRISFLEEKTVVTIMVDKPLTCSPTNFQCNPKYGLEEAEALALRIQERIKSK